MVDGQTYFRKLRASFRLWLEAHWFCWRYKRTWLFPLSIVMSYICLFGSSIGIVFLLTHHQLHTLRISAWVQHYGIHWYYFLILLAYYGCCNLIFSFFCISLTYYIGHAFRENDSLPYWQALKRTAKYWRYLLSAMLIGNPIIFILRVADYWSENGGRFVGRFFGCSKRMARNIFFSTAAFENVPMWRVIRNASQLWGDRGDKTMRLYFGWIYGMAFLSIPIVFIVMMFSISDLRVRILVGAVITTILFAIYMANLLVSTIFQTGIYFYLKGEKCQSEVPFLIQLNFLLQQDLG